MIFFKNQNQKARESAKETLRLTKKIYDYRRDILPESQVGELEMAMERFRELLGDKTTSTQAFTKAEGELEPLLKATGGSFYPKTFWADNVEVLLVAAILAIGIRSFFFQPFKIPTNSMYPSFNGMTAEVYQEGESPNPVSKLFNFLQLGAKHYELVAPADGDILFLNDRDIIPARKWFILPTKNARYYFVIDGERVAVDVPVDFDMGWVLKPFMSDDARLMQTRDGERYYWTGKKAEAGEAFLKFDLLTGDQLFVDRVRYHFVRPKVGDSIVFRTEEIEDMDAGNRGKYYIKRAVAGPGDELEIRPPELILNGQPIEGSKAFAKNAQQIENYPGYVIAGNPGKYSTINQAGQTVFRIPENHYFALGDNSPQSADSRFWGFVPEKEIVGTALFIYYPFSFRWGPAD